LRDFKIQQAVSTIRTATTPCCQVQANAASSVVVTHKIRRTSTTIKRIITQAARQSIRKTITQNTISKITTQNDFEIRQAVIAVRAEASASIQINRDRAASSSVVYPIYTITTIKTVIAQTARKRIGTLVAYQSVCLTIADDSIRPFRTEDSLKSDQSVVMIDKDTDSVLRKATFDREIDRDYEAPRGVALIVSISNPIITSTTIQIVGIPMDKTLLTVYGIITSPPKYCVIAPAQINAIIAAKTLVPLRKITGRTPASPNPSNVVPLCAISCRQFI